MTNSQKFKTVEERTVAFQHWCKNAPQQDCAHTECTECPFKWLDLEYKEEILPCPICGSPCHVHDNAVECTSGECAYECWQRGFRADQNVAVHNRVACAVMGRQVEVKT